MKKRIGVSNSVRGKLRFLWGCWQNTQTAIFREIKCDDFNVKPEIDIRFIAGNFVKSFCIIIFVTKLISRNFCSNFVNFLTNDWFHVKKLWITIEQSYWNWILMKFINRATRVGIFIISVKLLAPGVWIKFIPFIMKGMNEIHTSLLGDHHNFKIFHDNIIH